MSTLPGDATIDGYVAGSAYPTHVHADLMPAWLAAALRWQGVVPPPVRGPIRMLDIGCGDGIALTMTAASHPQGQFTGIDAMPGHAARGTAFGAAHGIGNVEIRCATFEDALAGDAGRYDYIICQGVIAWVHAQNRARVLDLAARTLAPGGVFAVGYNAMPGWQDRLTMQRMLRDLAGETGGPPAARFDAALDRVAGLREAGVYGLPQSRIDEVREMRGHVPGDYFPHEYLNTNWAPLWSSDVKAEMSARGLAFAGQAGFERLRRDFYLKRAQRDALDGIADPVLCDTLADVFCNTAFRVDLYVREAVAGPPADLVGDVWLGALNTVDNTAFACRTPAGRLSFDNPAARHLLDALASGPRRFGDIVADADLARADLCNAADALLTARHIQPVAPPHPLPHAGDMNRALLDAAFSATGPAVDALIGTHGTITLARNESLIAGTGTAALSARAAADPAFCARLFNPDTGPQDPEVLAAMASARTGTLARLARLGVAIPPPGSLACD
ncbi:MAG: methyltransferase regulatory domain-containing protein [Pseudomonadota bacterium]